MQKILIQLKPKQFPTKIHKRPQIKKESSVHQIFAVNTAEPGASFADKARCRIRQKKTVCPH